MQSFDSSAYACHFADPGDFSRNKKVTPLIRSSSLDSAVNPDTRGPSSSGNVETLANQLTETPNRLTLLPSYLQDYYQFGCRTSPAALQQSEVFEPNLACREPCAAEGNPIEFSSPLEVAYPQMLPTVCQSSPEIIYSSAFEGGACPQDTPSNLTEFFYSATSTPLLSQSAHFIPSTPIAHPLDRQQVTALETPGADSYDTKIAGDDIEYEDFNIWAISQCSDGSNMTMGRSGNPSNSTEYTASGNKRRRKRGRTQPPRPVNAFILYRRTKQREVQEANPGIQNKVVSKIIGQLWAQEPTEVKLRFQSQAERIKKLHESRYQGYKYQPKRQNLPNSTVSSLPSTPMKLHLEEQERQSSCHSFFATYAQHYVTPTYFRPYQQPPVLSAQNSLSFPQSITF